jgi:hypothetical protein
MLAMRDAWGCCSWKWWRWRGIPEERRGVTVCEFLLSRTLASSSLIAVTRVVSVWVGLVGRDERENY